MELTIISKGIEYKCLYDAEDHKLISKYGWFKSNNYIRGYARHKKQQIAMHRLIMGIVDNPNIEVDHINHNKLDNRKSNLRLCTRAENSRNVSPSGNTSKYLGVYRAILRKKINSTLYEYQYIRARIYTNNKRLFLGSFNTEKEAAKAYDAAAKKYHGEFANLNFK